MVTSGNVTNVAKDRLNLNFFRLLSIDVLFVRLFYVSFNVYNRRYAKFSRAKWGREWGKFRKRRPKRRYAILVLWANCSNSHCTVYEAAEPLYVVSSAFAFVTRLFVYIRGLYLQRLSDLSDLFRVKR